MPADDLRSPTTPRTPRSPFISPDEPTFDNTPRDCVRETPLPNGMLQLMAWDQEGRPGPFLVLPAAEVQDADIEWLLQRCRAMRPSGPAADLRLIG